MNDRLIKNLILFLAGFCVYITIETIFRGYSFVIMGVCGGLCVIIIDKINDRFSWDTDLFIQALCGSLLVTLMEFIIGEIALHTNLLPVMWDYSSMPLNFDGVICLPFSIAWIFLSVIAIFLADAINYYVFEDTVLPHYLLFNGLFVIVFRVKKCNGGSNKNDKCYC